MLCEVKFMRLSNSYKYYAIFYVCDHEKLVARSRIRLPICCGVGRGHLL